eukprot:GHVT01072995.1.p1 GENE.GHVT01072995.1~~GHVT01072995.1.p1  ORF type:complete len:167 (-),score=57.65 GHVT01072995.1:45-545(-)
MSWSPTASPPSGGGVGSFPGYSKTSSSSPTGARRHSGQISDLDALHNLLQDTFVSPPAHSSAASSSYGSRGSMEAATHPRAAAAGRFTDGAARGSSQEEWASPYEHHRGPPAAPDVAAGPPHAPRKTSAQIARTHPHPTRGFAHETHPQNLWAAASMQQQQQQQHM